MWGEEIKKLAASVKIAEEKTKETVEFIKLLRTN